MMNHVANLGKALLAFVLLLPFSTMSYASCSPAEGERMQKVAQAVVGALPRVNYSAARRGRFTVSPDQSTGAVAVKFSNLRRTLFEQTLNLQELTPNEFPGCHLVARPAKGRPGNGLFLRLGCEAAHASPGCAIVIQPGKNRSGESGWTFRVTGNRVLVPANNR